MKKHIFFVFTLVQVAYISTISCCPFAFSPEDQRPFFEQYKNSPITQKEKS